jgi:hypothetical protein
VVDRMVTSGYLGQWRAIHNAAGGKDPSSVTRDSEAVAQAPTRVNVSKRKQSEPKPTCTGANLYMLGKVADRKGKGVTCSRKEPGLN